VKPVVWLGDSLQRVREFSADARRVAGHQLEIVQAGREPADWKTMPSVGIGASELRVRTGDAYRVIYVAKFSEAIYVLHAFQKRTRKTARADIELARRRYRMLIAERRER
jgi:phage-related protein